MIQELLVSDVKEKRLVQLIRYLMNNNLYYRKAFLDVCLSNDKFNSDSFLNIPTLTKQDILDAGDKYYSTISDDVYLELTSGTTGIPLKCYKTKEERMLLAIEIWKERRRWDKNVSTTTFFPLMGINKKYGINFEDFNNENIKIIFSIINTRKPTWLCGSPTTIYNYAKKIEKGIVELIPTLKFIELQGEYCDSITRRYMEDCFQCKTILHYGNRECWAIAYECICGNMHLLNNIILENYNAGNNTNQLLLTSLINRYMPFVRYMTNDIGYVKYLECNCGKNGEIVHLEGGRIANLITGYDLIGDIFFKKIVHNVIINRGISLAIFHRYRVIQKNVNEFVFYYDPGTDFHESCLNEIKNEIKMMLGTDVKVYFSNSYFSNSGKYRLFEPYKI